MTEPNDKVLDEYLRRESAVSHRYRELEADDVPSQLDAAVMAQARAAVAPNRDRKPSWMKRGAPLALAASAVMAIAIVLEIGVQEEVRMPAPQVERTTAEAPRQAREQRFAEPKQASAPAEAPSPAAPPPPVTLAREEAARRQQSRIEEAVRERRATTRAPAAAAPQSTERAAIESVIVNAAPIQRTMEDAALPVEVFEAADEDLLAPEIDASDVQTLATEDRVSAPAPVQTDARSESEQAKASAPASVRTTAARAGATDATFSAAQPAPQVPRLEPEPWLEQIRALRREGKVLEADEQWREFVAAYPQYEVSKTDTARPRP